MDSLYPKFIADHERQERMEKSIDELRDRLDDEVKERLLLDDRVDVLEAKAGKGGNGGNGGGSNNGGDGALAGRLAALEAKVAALQAAVAALKTQQNQANQSVRAPFQVVDASNRPLFRVAQAGSGARVNITSNSADSVIEFSTETGGVITVTDPAGVQRVQLGQETDGRYSLNLFSAQKQPIAKMSSAKAGGGGIVGVFDKTGVPRIYMDGGIPTMIVQDEKAQPAAVIGMEEGHGVMGILYNGTTLAGLGAYSAGGAGRLWINDSDGNWLFKAGKNASGGDACASSSKAMKCLVTGLR